MLFLDSAFTVRRIDNGTNTASGCSYTYAQRARWYGTNTASDSSYTYAQRACWHGWFRSPRASNVSQWSSTYRCRSCYNLLGGRLGAATSKWIDTAAEPFF